MKTTTKKVMALAIFSSTLLFSGCQKDLYDPDYVASKNGLLTGVPSDFNWSTISSVDLTVNVDDQYNGEFYYVVEVFDSNPIIDSNSKLLGKGVAKKGQAFSTVISVPQTTKSLAIRQTSPTGITITRVVDIASSVTLDFGTTTKAIATRSNYVSIATKSITVSDSDFPTSAPAGTAKFNKNNFSANSSYTLDNNFDGNVDLGGNTDISLYVSGKVHLTYLYLTANSKLYLLPGAEVTSDNNNLGQSGGVISINTGAKLILTSTTEASSNIKILNKGAIEATNVNTSLKISNSAQLYNNGTISLAGKLSGENGQSYIENYGTITAQNLETAGNSSMTNAGIVNITETTSVSSTNAVWRNESGTYTTKNMDITGRNPNSFNACKLIVTNLLNLNSGTLKNDAGAYVSCNTLYMDNAKIDMGNNAILSVLTQANYNWNPKANSYGIYGPNTGKALLKIKKVVQNSGSYPIINYGGNLQIECQDHPSINVDPYNVRYTEDSSVEWVPLNGTSMTIEKSGCSEGNNAATGHTPADPTFPIEVAPSTYYTYAMEDLWPDYGDYDFNDIVVTVNYDSQIISNDNKVHKLTINAKLRALGATKTLAAALQFDQIPAEKIKSISYSIILSDGSVIKKASPTDGSVFEVNDNGVETEQTKAVIPLFDNAYNFLETSGETNTVVGGKKVDPKTVLIEIQFTTGNNKEVDQSDIDIKNLNFFIVTDKQKTNRTEVHLAGYNPTDKANLGLFGTGDDNSNNGTKYLSKSNLVWGMMIPTIFNYPLEGTSILNAYPDFKAWAISGGTQNTNWHDTPNSNFIYK